MCRKNQENYDSEEVPEPEAGWDPAVAFIYDSVAGWDHRAHTETSFAEVYVAQGAGSGVIWDIDFDLNFFDFHWGLAELVMKKDIDDFHLFVPLRIVGGCLPLLQRAQADLARTQVGLHRAALGFLRNPDQDRRDDFPHKMVNSKFGVSVDAGKDFMLAMARLLCSDFFRWKILKSNVADPFVKVLHTSKQLAACMGKLPEKRGVHGDPRQVQVGVVRGEMLCDASLMWGGLDALPEAGAEVIVLDAPSPLTIRIGYLDETVLLVPRNYVKVNSVSLRFLTFTEISVAYARTEIGLESPVHLALLAFTNDAVGQLLLPNDYSGWADSHFAHTEACLNGPYYRHVPGMCSDE